MCINKNTISIGTLKLVILILIMRKDLGPRKSPPFRKHDSPHGLLYVTLIWVKERMLKHTMLDGHNSSYTQHKNKISRLHTFKVVPKHVKKVGPPW